MRRSTAFPSLFLLTVVAVSAIISAIAGAPVTAQEPQGTGGWPFRSDTLRVFTDSQATAGQAVFTKVCSECHESKDVTGPDFRTKWVGQPLFTLYEQIRTTMPDGNPGSLSREEYSAALAYILKLNGLGAGQKALGSDSLSLAAIKFELPAPPARP